MLNLTLSPRVRYIVNFFIGKGRVVFTSTERVKFIINNLQGRKG